MHEYRTIIYRLQQGQTIREINRTRIAGRRKIKAIKEVAEQQGWLDPKCTLPGPEGRNVQNRQWKSKTY